jgi:thiol-disulfide isomerase/thioredoxin
LARAAAAAVAGAALLAACGGSPEGERGAVVAGAVDAGPGAGAGTEALDFQVSTVDGEPFDASALEGRPTILWFWAPWCTVCRAEGPDVAVAAAAIGEEVPIIGVAGRGDAAAMQEFVADTGTGGITHVNDADGSVWARFGVVAQPAFAFVAADGRVQVFSGALGESGLQDAAAQLAAAQP